MQKRSERHQAQQKVRHVSSKVKVAVLLLLVFATVFLGLVIAKEQQSVFVQSEASRAPQSVPEVAEPEVEPETLAYFARGTGLPEDASQCFQQVDEDGTLELKMGYSIPKLTYTPREKPTVLIYHTHATEAYRQEEANPYTPIGAVSECRTYNKSFNVCSVGAALAEQLTTLGYEVTHDSTNVEKPVFTTSYRRSLLIIRKYPPMDLYIDLHRDWVRNDAQNTVLVEGQPAAKFFFVVGTGIGTYEGEYERKPDWALNYRFAQDVTAQVNRSEFLMCRPPMVKVGRFNQQRGLSLLVELGNNNNTLAEALQAVPVLANGIDEVLRSGEKK